ncbi:hypothetical protein GQ44DRAFT_744121 [Phaeosphaeriaceae sp. PMI808]|nr:hypothetical protein GQ44DRAFT_744121 [Phaeosphaeriaceae sp. PMI808]
MSDIWSGDIVFPNGNVIKDVGLSSPNAECSAFAFKTLRFLTTVDTTKVPLYLAAGPSLDVWTTCAATEAWFESILLSQTIAAGNATNITNCHLSTAHAPRLTEILFYGTMTPSTASGLPTPPSSSPEHDNAQVNGLPELRQHHSVNADTQFLPPCLDTQHAPPSPKRKRDIFQGATIAGKKQRGKGGIGVAASAARTGESQSSTPLSRPPSAHGSLSRSASRQLSRSPSISSDTRPPSRICHLDGHNKRSTLSQVATLSRQPAEPTIESKNKEVLSRVVMAAMRMHGLQQRNKASSRRASIVLYAEDNEETNTATLMEEAAKDEEYKLMYHQTYKGAAFALRKHITKSPLHAQPDRLRDVVEKLLTIYLSDPLAHPLLTNDTPNPMATPGCKPRLGVPGSIDNNASPFDMPSAARSSVMKPKTNSHVHTGSPVRRK